MAGSGLKPLKIPRSRTPACPHRHCVLCHGRRANPVVNQSQRIHDTTMGTRRTHPIPLPHMERLPLNRAQTSKDTTKAKRRLSAATSNQSPQANALQHNTGLRRWQEEKGKPTTRHSTNRCHNQADALRTHSHQPGSSRQSSTNVLNERGASVTLIPRSALQGSANSNGRSSSRAFWATTTMVPSGLRNAIAIELK